MLYRLCLIFIFTLSLCAETSWNVKTSSDYASVGEAIRFFVEIKNANVAPMNANVLYKFPKQFQFVSSNIKKTSTSPSVMKWNVAVAAQSTFTLEIKMKATLGAMKTKNYFQLRSNNRKSFITSNIRVYGGIPSIAIHSYYSDDPCVVGEKAAYTIIIENRGTSVVTNIKMAVGLSKRLSLISAIVKTRQNVQEKYRWKQDILTFETQQFLEPGKKITYDLYCKTKQKGKAKNTVWWSFWELGREFVHEKEMSILSKNKNSEVVPARSPNLDVTVH